MNRKVSVFVFLSMFLIPVAARAASPAPSAADVIKKVHAKEATLKSYSFVVHRSDLADSFVLKRNEEGLKAYKAIIDKLSILTRQSKDVSKGSQGYKVSKTTSLFIKPFSVQVSLDESQFLPSFLVRSKVIYRPDINNAYLFLKEPYLGMLIGQEITNESALVLISNWTYELMEMDCALANGGAAKVAGTEKFNGKPALTLDIAIKKGSIPWAVGCGGKRKDIPANAHVQLSRELQLMSDRLDKFKNERAVIRYFIDPQSWLIVGKEVTFGKTLAIHLALSNIKLNNVKPDDLEMVKKP